MSEIISYSSYEESYTSEPESHIKKLRDVVLEGIEVFEELAIMQDDSGIEITKFPVYVRTDTSGLSSIIDVRYFGSELCVGDNVQRFSVSQSAVDNGHKTEVSIGEMVHVTAEMLEDLVKHEEVYREFTIPAIVAVLADNSFTIIENEGEIEFRVNGDDARKYSQEEITGNLVEDDYIDYCSESMDSLAQAVQFEILDRDYDSLVPMGEGAVKLVIPYDLSSLLPAIPEPNRQN